MQTNCDYFLFSFIVFYIFKKYQIPKGKKTNDGLVTLNFYFYYYYFY